MFDNSSCELNKHSAEAHLYEVLWTEDVLEEVFGPDDAVDGFGGSVADGAARESFLRGFGLTFVALCRPLQVRKIEGGKKKPLLVQEKILIKLCFRCKCSCWLQSVLVSPFWWRWPGRGIPPSRSRSEEYLLPDTSCSRDCGPLEMTNESQLSSGWRQKHSISRISYWIRAHLCTSVIQSVHDQLKLLEEFHIIVWTRRIKQGRYTHTHTTLNHNKHDLFLLWCHLL